MIALLTIEQQLRWAKSQLCDPESAALDCRLLMCHVLDCNQAYLLTWPDKSLTQSQSDLFKHLITQRQQGHPVAHLLGYRDFWSLRLRVNPSTLIPRPETELLVETALTLPIGDHVKVLDLGTGTGAIALALASEKPDWQITAVDFQPEAVKLAMKNQDENGLSNVKIMQSDWFSAVGDETFHLIVSNPPYVEDDSFYLEQGDVRFEPRTALTAGRDGLYDIRRISAQLDRYLCAGGWVIFEHGNLQGPPVQQILIQSGLDKVQTINDLNDQPRITIGCKSR